MKISINTYRWELHKLVQRPLHRMLDEPFDFKRPSREIDLGRTVGIEHRPLLRARLSRRYALLAPRIRTDDYFGIPDLFRVARVGRLVLRIDKHLVEKTHFF